MIEITRRTVALCVVLSVAGLAACSRHATNEKAAQAPPSAGAGQAAAAAPSSQAGGQTVTGTITETMDASNYTYVHVKGETQDIWAAAPQTKVAVGERVVVPLEMPMQNFHSKTLNRDFPVIYFVSGLGREGQPAPPPLAVGHGGAMGGGSASGESAETAAVTEPIAPPPGGTTIGKVWASRDSLAGRTITVRGKVVKFNGGILDRNWLHIQDGSGSAQEGTHDLTLTTSDVARVGDVVTVTGKVATNRDFGAGYAYKVILEGATIKR